MLLLRHTLVAVADLARYTVRSGRWWVVLCIIAVGLAVVLAAASQTVVPTAVYTLL